MTQEKRMLETTTNFMIWSTLIQLSVTSFSRVKLILGSRLGSDWISQFADTLLCYTSTGKKYTVARSKSDGCTFRALQYRSQPDKLLQVASSKYLGSKLLDIGCVYYLVLIIIAKAQIRKECIIGNKPE